MKPGDYVASFENINIISNMTFWICVSFLFASLFGCSMPPNVLGDWHIVLSNVVSHPPPGMTNIVVRKLETGAVREELSPSRSVIFLSASNQIILLDHSNRTYVRQRVEHEPGIASAAAADSGQEVFGGALATVQSWTNQSGSGRAWLLPMEAFIEKLDTHPISAATNTPSNIAAGAIVGSNQIVAATEQVMKTPPHPDGSEAGVIQTIRATLVSIAQTNCSPAEFEIPEGYREVSMQTDVKVRPSIFGSRMQGIDSIQSLRKRYEAGGPVLTEPSLQPAK